MKGGKALLILLAIIILFGVGGALLKASKTAVLTDQVNSIAAPVPSLVSENDTSKTGSTTMESYTTADGMTITTTTAGTGAEAKAGNTVSVHYTGKFDNGEVFDSSVTRGTPFTFILGAGQVIKGWDEGVAGMKVGEKRTLVIPYTLAYGEQGYGSIPPKATLTFDVELLAVQ